jgi:hypothetical protein
MFVMFWQSPFISPLMLTTGGLRQILSARDPVGRGPRQKIGSSFSDKVKGPEERVAMIHPNRASTLGSLAHSETGLGHSLRHTLR